MRGNFSVGNDALEEKTLLVLESFPLLLSGSIPTCKKGWILVRVVELAKKSLQKHHSRWAFNLSPGS